MELESTVKELKEEIEELKEEFEEEKTEWQQKKQVCFFLYWCLCACLYVCLYQWGRDCMCWYNWLIGMHNYELCIVIYILLHVCDGFMVVLKLMSVVGCIFWGAAYICSFQISVSVCTFSVVT